MSVIGGNSIDDAKVAFQSKLDEGTTCPCCGRFAKRYRRKINSSMGASLVALVNISDRRMADAFASSKSPTAWEASAWVHANDVGEYLKAQCEASGRKSPSYPQGEIGKLVHWRLVESMPGETRGAEVGVASEGRGRTSGFWRPTPAGVEFVRRTSSVQRVAVLWDNHLEGFEGEDVKIDQVLGDHFDWRELMSASGAGGVPG